MLVEVHLYGHLTALLLHMIAVVPFEWRFVYVGSKELTIGGFAASR